MKVEEMEGLLLSHLTSPVQWQRSIEWIAKTFEVDHYLELGPKSVLAPLIRTIDPSVQIT